MASLVGHIRYALRQFRQSPVFTTAAVLTLALGIGGTTAIFTLIDAVMLRSLPVGDPAALYRVGEGDNCCVQGGPQGRWGMYSYPLYERLEAATPEFEQIMAFQAGLGRMGVRREKVDVSARPLRTEYVTGNYFSVLGVHPFGGRLLTREDDGPAAAPVAVLSYHVWQSTYGGDPAVVGSTFVIEGHPFTIIGVAAPGFFGETLRGDPPDLWIPLQQEPLINAESSILKQSVSAWLRVIGRLKPGATTAGMGPRLTTMLRQWMLHDSGYPANWLPEVEHSLPKQVINVVPAGAGVEVMKEEYGESLKMLLGVCGLVLLIACANVANLLLARSAARRGQTAVRLAIGANRRRIVMQALTESVLLAIGGAVAGLVVALGAAKLLIALAFQTAKFLPISVVPSWKVLLSSFVLALITGVIFGAVPAWAATRTSPSEALRGVSRSLGDHSSLTRKVLLITQATLSVVLVAGATMLGRSLNKLQNQDFGFQVPGRIVVQLQPVPATYSLAKLNSLYRELESRINALPGVRGSGLAVYNPLTDNWSELVLVAGHPAPAPGEEAGASWDRVSANYLQNLGVPLVRGRMLSAADNENSEPVAVVNEAFVKRFFKNGEEPLERHFGLDVPKYADTFRIVGVVGDAKFAGFALSKPARPMFYVALAQNVDYSEPIMKMIEQRTHFARGLLLVTNASPSELEPQLTRILSEVDSNLAINSIRTLRKQIEFSFDQERAVASLSGLFGIVALLLAGIGLYGVTAYSVAQRTNEIGLRMALGADRGSVLRLILHGAFNRVLIGLALGIPLAVGAGRLISSQLYGVRVWDPLALAAAALALALAALIASIVPATRASAISPMSALRVE